MISIDSNFASAFRSLKYKIRCWRQSLQDKKIRSKQTLLPYICSTMYAKLISHFISQSINLQMKLAKPISHLFLQEFVSWLIVNRKYLLCNMLLSILFLFISRSDCVILNCLISCLVALKF